MKLRRLFAKAPAAHACHFCGQASVLVPPYGDGDAQLARTQDRAARVSSGTPARWFCSACGSWNHRGADGQVLDVWERAMWDVGANESAFATPSKVHEEDHVFCRDCLTNQTIVTNLLANYLSGDEAADEGLLATLPEYKRSLEARYPIACEACAQKANARIASVDQRVQQQLLGSWVERHAAPRDVHDEAAAFQAAVRRWHWQQRHWALVQASGLGLGLYMAQHSTPDVVVAALCLGALMPTTYDPMWRRAEAIRRRNAHPVEHGLVVWKALWIIRFGLVLCVLTPVVPWTYVGSVAVLLQAMLVLHALARRRVTSPEPVRLVSREVTTPRKEAVGTDPLAAMSLGATRAAPPLDALLEPVPSAGEAMDIEDDTPPTLRFGPQRFPTAPSGLEDLFEERLALEPRTELREPAWHWTTSNLPLVAVLLLGVVLGLVLRND